MLKLIFSLVLITSSIGAFSQSTKVQILGIDEPSVSSEPYLIFTDDGFVYELENDRSDLINIALDASVDQATVELTLSDDHATTDLLGLRSSVKEIKLLAQSGPISKSVPFLDRPEVSVAPIMNSYITNLSSDVAIENLFKRLTKKTRRKSQCYNRAHMWSWQLNQLKFNERRIQTGKVWIYFTKKYIRTYRYKWWFHIAPYLKVNGQERVMDRTFFDGPVPVQTWTDKFIKTNEVCTEVKLYSEYRARNYTDNCVIIKSSVFYWQPHQLKNAEKKGTEKTGWVAGEIRRAYSDSLGRRSKAPGLNNL